MDDILAVKIEVATCEMRRKHTIKRKAVIHVPEFKLTRYFPKRNAIVVLDCTL